MGIRNWKSANSLKTKSSLYFRFVVNILVMCFSVAGFVLIPYIIISGHLETFQFIDGFVIFASLILFAAMFFGMFYELKIVVKRIKSKDYTIKRGNQ